MIPRRSGVTLTVGFRSVSPFPSPFPPPTLSRPGIFLRPLGGVPAEEPKKRGQKSSAQKRGQNIFLGSWPDPTDLKKKPHVFSPLARIVLPRRVLKTVKAPPPPVSRVEQSFEFFKQRFV